MPQVTIDMDDETDKKVRIYMAHNDIRSKAEAIIAIIKLLQPRLDDKEVEAKL